ncbi:MAG: hypothetical protein CVU88_06555 [Firmicutes bacterium HGW-Firmicutes-13]|nr:MAG: hypothetical protein CVU88_06555 [Firmicutes bacterium HGW-Firmicutes-13]
MNKSIFLVNKGKRILFFTTLIFLIVYLLSGTALAKSYEIPEVYIEARILEDGSVLVEEQRTVEFQGSFSWFEQWIFIRGNSFFDNFTVREGKEIYREDYSQTPGTYQVDKTGDKVVVKWYYQARDERRTFTINYRAHNITEVHKDAADFQYQFIGDDWELPTGQATVKVVLPDGVRTEDIRAWGHGPLHGDVDMYGNTVIFQVKNLPRDKFLEGRILFPPELVPFAENRTGRYALQEILAEEEALAKKANTARFKNLIDWALAPVVFLLTLTAIFYFWLKFGREYKPDFEGDYYRELPADYSPAELGVLYRFDNITPADLTATILDLARRGYLIIEEGDERKTGLFKKKADYKLSRTEKKRTEDGDKPGQHEKRLLDYLFEDISIGHKEVFFSEIEDYARNKPGSFQRFYSGWKTNLRLETDKHDFFDPATLRAKQVEFAVGMSLVFLGFIGLFTGFLVLGMTAVICGILIGVSASLLRRRSQKGVTEFTMWTAFRRFLLHFSQLDRAEIPSLIIWEHYLVYAVTLGVAKEVIKQLEIIFPGLQEGNYRFGYGWYYMPYGRVSSGMPAPNFESLTSGLQQSFQSAVNYRPASSSGTGGGFSGGGGGFGGGGGRAG